MMIGDVRSMKVEPKVTIQNAVASARFEHRIELKRIVKAFPEVEYRPETFPGLVFRVNNPKAAILIFETGRMVCTGAKSVRDVRKAIHKAVRELTEASIIIASRPRIEIQNIVASVDLGNVAIDLDQTVHMAYGLGSRVIYEPDQFPGAIYYMQDPQVVFLIFATGKLVCAGARREEDIHRAVEKLLALLDENDLIIKA